MPKLYVIGGANGCGKTTWYNTAVQRKFIDPQLSFINVDLITLQELGGYSEENFARADLIARQRIKMHIDNHENFMIESNLSKSSDYDWLQSMSKNGYELILYFLGTDDIDINYGRVKKRVKEGGHDVPENIILHRYQMSQSYLKSKIFLFSEAYFIDNSESFSKIMAVFKIGKITQKEENCSNWVNDILSLVIRLQGKNL